MANTIKDTCVHIIHVREGAIAAMYALGYGVAKTRRAIVKSFSGWITRIATDEYGYMVLLQALHVVDDTVLLAKALVQDIVENAGTLVTSAYGHKVLLGLCRPELGKLIPAVFTEFMGAGEGLSKKDANLRCAELVKAAQAGLITACSEHYLSWAKDPYAWFVVCECLELFGAENQNHDFLQTIMTTLADDKDLSNHPIAHRVLVRLCKGSQPVHQAARDCIQPLILKHLSTLLTGRGVFVVLAMVEAEAPHAGPIFVAVKKKQGKLSGTGTGVTMLKTRVKNGNASTSNSTS